MQLNTSTCYAIQIVLALAQSKKTVSSTHLAESTMISQRYIIQITHKLRESGLIHSFTGSDGGYVLYKEPSDISLYDIIAVTEGRIGIPQCLNSETCPGVYSALNIAQIYLISYLKTLTVDMLVAGNVEESLTEIIEKVRAHVGDIKAFEHAHS